MTARSSTETAVRGDSTVAWVSARMAGFEAHDAATMVAFVDPRHTAAARPDGTQEIETIWAVLAPDLTDGSRR